jgi:hypothetical protein
MNGPILPWHARPDRPDRDEAWYEAWHVDGSNSNV